MAQDPRSVPETPEESLLPEIERRPSASKFAKPFLPPVPRNANKMLSRLVEQPMMEKDLAQHQNEGNGGANDNDNNIEPPPFRTGVSTPMGSRPKKKDGMGYSSTGDPFLNKFWNRKIEHKKALKDERAKKMLKRQQDKEKNFNPAVAIHPHRGGGAASPSSTIASHNKGKDRKSRRRRGSRSDESTDDTRSSSSSSGRRRSSMSSYSADSDADSDHHQTDPAALQPVLSQRTIVSQTSSQARGGRGPSQRQQIKRAAWNISNFPLNETEISLQEFTALNTILVPRPGFETRIKTPNCDLQWLREYLDSRSNKPHPVSKKWKTLHTAPFETLLATDMIKYGEGENSFDTPVINSPRSTIILLRNGVSPYMLMKRPPEFYIKLGEAVEEEILDARVERAEIQREALLTSLRAQYDELGATHTVERVVDYCREKLKENPLAGSLSASFEARKDRDMRAMEFIQARSKKLAEEEGKKREENARKMVAIEQTLHRKTEEKKAAIALQGQEMKEKLANKARILKRIQREQLAQALEAQATRDAESERRAEAIKKQRHDRLMDLKRKGREASVEHDRKLRVASERREERLAALHSLEDKKMERVRLRQEQQVAEREALKAKQVENEEKRSSYKRRAEEKEAELVAKVEKNLEHREELNKAWTEKQQQKREVERLRQEEKQQHRSFTVEHAKRVQEQHVVALLEKRAQVDQAVDSQKQRNRKERREKRENQEFYLAEKKETVDLRMQQDTYQKLLNLASFAARDNQIDAFKIAHEEQTVKTREMRKAMHLSHEGARVEAAKKQLAMERQTCQESYDITNPAFKHLRSMPYKDVSARIDHGQFSDEDNEDHHHLPPRSMSVPLQKKKAVAASANTSAHKKKHEGNAKDKSSKTLPPLRNKSSKRREEDEAHHGSSRPASADPKATQDTNDGSLAETIGAKQEDSASKKKGKKSSSERSKKEEPSSSVSKRDSSTSKKVLKDDHQSEQEQKNAKKDKNSEDKTDAPPALPSHHAPRDSEDDDGTSIAVTDEFGGTMHTNQAEESEEVDASGKKRKKKAKMHKKEKRGSKQYDQMPQAEDSSALAATDPTTDDASYESTIGFDSESGAAAGRREIESSSSVAEDSDFKNTTLTSRPGAVVKSDDGGEDGGGNTSNYSYDDEFEEEE